MGTAARRARSRAAQGFALGIALAGAISSAGCPWSSRPRVAALTPAASELVLVLGAGAWLCGVDSDSQQDPRFAALPALSLDTALSSGADLVVAAAGSAAAGSLAALSPRARASPAVIELDPHSFEEAFSAATSIGAALGREAAAERWARGLRLELAKISAMSLNQPRPRIAVLVTLDPPVLAGGHSFLTELVEIAGAENLTHGTEQREVPTDLPALVAAAPDLVLIASAEGPGPELPRALAGARIGSLRFEVWPIDASRFWVQSAVATARALRARVVRLAAASQS